MIDLNSWLEFPTFSEKLAAAGIPSGPIVATVAAPAAVVTQPSWWQSFLQPFKTTIQSIGQAAPTLVTTAGQALNTILLQKAGLIPKSQPMGDGTVVNYQKPQAGNAPPTTINIQQPSPVTAPGGVVSVMQNVPWGTLAMIAAALLVFVMLLGSGSRQPATILVK